MALFSLIAKLGIDKTGFDAGLKQAGASAAQFGSGLKHQFAAAFSIAAISAYTKHLIEYASKVSDAAKKTGASTTALQTLGHAAKLTGSDFDDVVQSLGKLSKARQEALDEPNSKTAEVFRALGIDAQKLRDLKLEDVFREIARAFGSNDFGASSLAMVQTILGKSAGDLLPMFIEGMDRLEKEAMEAGVVLDEGVLGTLEEIGDTMDEMAGQLRGGIGEALLGFVTVVNDLLVKLRQGLELLTNFREGFAGGFDRDVDLPAWMKRLPGLEKLIKLWKGVKAGREQVAIAQNEGEAGGDADAVPEDGLMFGFRKDVEAAEALAARRKRVFNFEDIAKLATPKVHTSRIQSDELGKIGGTVGGGESTTSKQLRDIISQLKELRRDLGLRGVRIAGEL